MQELPPHAKTSLVGRVMRKHPEGLSDRHLLDHVAPFPRDSFPRQRRVGAGFPLKYFPELQTLVRS